MTNPKKLAGEKAVKYIKDGMTIGLGTGSTAFFAIQKIGERIQKEGLKVQCIATSIQSENLAKELNIPLIAFDKIDKIDITIDGADEINPSLDMIKGGGGALLREKIIAHITQYYIIVVDESKYVEKLGKFGLPVEVVPFGWQKTAEHLQALGAKTTLRKQDNITFVTDNGNYIIDCDFGFITTAGTLESTIHNIPGVVECGLFVNRTHKLIIGKNDNTIAEINK